MEIRLVRKKFQTLYGNLLSAEYRQAETTTKAFIDYLKAQPLLGKILHALPGNTIDIDAWAKELWSSSNLGMPDNEPLRVSFCLAVLEKYKDDPTQIAHMFHISSNGITDHVRVYLESVAKPVYQYFDQELTEQEFRAEPLSAMGINANNVVIIQGHNYGTIAQSSSDAIKALDELVTMLQAADLADNAKIDAIASADTIKAQFARSVPDRGILRLAWPTVKDTAELVGASELVARLEKVIGV